MAKIGRTSERAATAGTAKTVGKSSSRRNSHLLLVRSLFVVLSFLVLFSGLSLLHTFASSEEVRPAEGSEIMVLADTGDTLWSIAAAHKKEGMDTRQAIHLIKKRNGLKDSSLQSGQTLIIPADLTP